MARIAASKLGLPLLPNTCAAHFPDRPLVWVVRGRYRSGGLRGQGCSAQIHTRANCSDRRAREIAESAHPWVRVESVSAWGWTAPPSAADDSTSK